MDLRSFTISVGMEEVLPKSTAVTREKTRSVTGVYEEHMEVNLSTSCRFQPPLPSLYQLEAMCHVEVFTNNHKTKLQNV